MNLTSFQQKTVALIMLVSSVNFFMGCNRYFKPVVLNTPTAETTQASLKKLSNQNKFFILRTKDYSYAMRNIVFDETSMTMKGIISELPVEHFLYVDAIGNKYKIPKRGNAEYSLLEEVHLFVTNSTQIDTLQPFVLPLSAVERIEVIEKDAKRTTSSYVWGIAGVTLGAGLMVILLVAMFAPDPEPVQPVDGSCPYISTLVGDEFELQGEIYSGAIYPALQKEDYLPLKMKAIDGAYHLKISNELKEIQYTDFANLVVAEHDANVRLLVDPQGEMHTVSQPEMAFKAILNNRTDVSSQLSKNDYNSCLFKDDNGTENKEDLYLSFNNFQGKNKAKLILNARSSSWFNYLYNEFTKGFGNQYQKWTKNQEKKTASELEKWIQDQHIPLTISIKTLDGWKEVNKLNTIGPLLNREVVIPLNVETGKPLEVKVSGGYLFWELDYAAIDYSEDAPFRINEITPYEAINEKGLNVLPQLQYADKTYLEQPNVGDSTVIKYKETSFAAGKTQTFFFHTSGYYNHPRHHTGMPKVGFLKSFEQPGALSAFSKRKFMESVSALETAKN
ncbi:MAG: hypothetical protein V4717_20155 [Bacteroidota bacterium]